MPPKKESVKRSGPAKRRQAEPPEAQLPLKQRKYHAEPSAATPRYTVDSKDVMAFWERAGRGGKWYPITIRKNATFKEDGQWMYEVRWEGYNGIKRKHAKEATNESTYPEAWIWERKDVPPQDIAFEVLPRKKGETITEPPLAPTASPTKPSAQVEVRPGAKAGIAVAQAPAAKKLLPCSSRPQPAALESPKPKVPNANPRPPGRPPGRPPKGTKGEPRQLQAIPHGAVKKQQTAPVSTATGRPATKAPQHTPAVPTQTTRKTAQKEKEKEKEEEEEQDTSSVYLDPPSITRPLYSPTTHQYMMAFFRGPRYPSGMWFPIILLRESTRRNDKGQWMYDVQWIGYEDSSARNGEASNESEYPENWIWERKDVPPREITPWARKRERVMEIMERALAQLRRPGRPPGKSRPKTSGGDTSTDGKGPGRASLTVQPLGAEVGGADRGSRKRRLEGWKPVIHSSELDVGMTVRMRPLPVSGYQYAKPAYFGQRATILCIQGYPPVKCKFQDGGVYWCDYQDLQLFGEIFD
uniref:Chromo domain-containing protein n=1 Tax=Eutreptiella gymnastica TaxID=73025 RepID=A0A7S1IJ15_9EUGL|mmetsp:Transcript_21244/g.38116  ORF Transcript_21244/g.38116 Transcript_21244/m.38116 type:complete len:525 (+) Transcript_21244:69-1643(+)